MTKLYRPIGTAHRHKCLTCPRTFRCDRRDPDCDGPSVCDGCFAKICSSVPPEMESPQAVEHERRSAVHAEQMQQFRARQCGA